MENATSLPGSFPHGISRRLSLGFALIVATILLWGGVSVLLASKIYRNQTAVAQEYLHLEYLDQIDLIFDNMLYKLQGLQASWRPEQLEDVRVLRAELMRRLALFREAHQRRNGSAWEPREEALFGDLLRLAEDLQPLITRVLATPAAPHQPPLPALNRISFIFQDLRRRVEDLSHLHRGRATDLLQNSQRLLRAIVALYVVFIPTGCLLILKTSTLFRRRVALPLRTLADAALGIAEGNSGHRVPVTSRDEFGAVSHAFNLMADRVETREREIAELNMGLQQRVLERTRELEETLRHLTAAQEALVHSERAALTGQIAAAVTHGIRTPLSALAINLQLLRRALDRGLSSPEGAGQLLSTADLEVNRINRTLEEFFRYARLPKPKMATVDCNALLQQVAAFLQAQAKDARVNMSLRLEGDLPPIQADGDQLREAVENLASNAIEAMPDGGRLVFQTCKAPDDQAQAILVRISDTGIGIPPQALPHIFVPFRSTKSRGLGLGLAIAMRIAEEHGGTIQCRSEEGTGTTFELCLPLSPPDRSSGGG